MTDLVTGESGEGHLEDDEARELTPRSIHHVVPVVGLHDVVARFLEDTGGKRPRVHLVVGDQNRSQAPTFGCHSFTRRAS